MKAQTQEHAGFVKSDSALDFDFETMSGSKPREGIKGVSSLIHVSSNGLTCDYDKHNPVVNSKFQLDVVFGVPIFGLSLVFCWVC